MKKLLTILSIMLAVNSSVVASELNKPEINPESGMVNVSGELGIEFASRRVALFVKKAEDNTINWFDSIKCNDSGEYSFNYLMKGNNGKEYTVYISIENSDLKYDTSFVFYDAKQENASLWSKIEDGKPTKDTSVIKDIINTRAEYLSLDTEMYESFSEELKDKVCESLYDGLENMYEFKTKFSQTCAVWNLNSFDGEEVTDFAEALDKIIDGQADCAEKVIKNLSESERKKVYSIMIDNDYTDVQSIVDDYNKTVIVTAANAANVWGEMKTLLLDSYSLLNINLSTYNQLKDKITPISKMLKNYSSLEEIADTFNTVVNEQYKVEQNNSLPTLSTGSSLSGGGTKNSLSNVSVSVPAPTSVNGNQPITKVFSDVENLNWAESSITLLNKRGIMSGYDGKFYPNDNITRAEFVKALMCYFDFEDKSREFKDFSDVSDNEWYYDYIKKAYENGIINGVAEDRFSPLSSITRQDMALIIYNSISKNRTLSESNLDFQDGKSISDYAKLAVGTLRAKGIINGFEDETFRPFECATRAQAAVMISNIIYYMENVNN